MPYLDGEDFARWTQLHHWTQDRDSTIRAALSMYCDHMVSIRDGLARDVERIDADPDLAASLDGTLVTANGYRQTYGLFKEQAERAVTTLKEYLDVMDPAEEEPA